MKLLILICIVASGLVGCAVDPITHRKVYVGPVIKFNGGYEGVNFGVEIDPSYSKQKK